jgi:hypothetical protein
MKIAKKTNGTMFSEVSGVPSFWTLKNQRMPTISTRDMTCNCNFQAFQADSRGTVTVPILGGWSSIVIKS